MAQATLAVILKAQGQVWTEGDCPASVLQACSRLSPAHICSLLMV